MAKKTPAEKTIKVRAVEGYSNGTIVGAARWPGGEVRELPLSAYRMLLTDNPTNFEVVEAPAPVAEPAADTEQEPEE